jgi:hypothetical protein
MTDVVKSKNALIHTAADARALYHAAPAGFQGKVGMEVEMALYRADGNKPVIPTAAEMTKLYNDLKAKGFDAQLEAAGVLEYASPPAPLSDVAGLVQVIKQDLEAFRAEAAAAGFTRAPFCVMPTTTTQEALARRVSRERLEASLAALPEVVGPQTVNIPLLTTGVQASFSPKDDEEMFRMAGRAYALTPLLMACMDSSSGFAENGEARRDLNIRAAYYSAYGDAGGIAESFLTAENAQDYIDRHIKAVFETPMFFAYDLDGSLVKSTRDNVLTFAKLAEKGLNTQSNYELAESFIYNDVKICNLRDAAGQVVGKRLEVRAADSGLHQPVSTLLLTAALIPDGKTADAFDSLLKDYGFTGHPPTDTALLRKAHHDVTYHEGKFMNVAFGTGRLRDFAADVAGLVAAHYETEKSLSPDVSKLAEILLTGKSDAQCNSENYKSLADVTADLLQKAAVKTPANANRPRQGPAAGKKRAS